MKITFLGTGTSQGVPVIACTCEVCMSGDHKDKRLRSSILIEYEGRNVVIDTGPDFRYQMLRAKVDHLDAVIYTHSHKDHIAGLDDIRAFNRIQGTAIDIYAADAVQDALKREYHYAFDPFAYFGVPQLNLVDIDARHSFTVFGKSFTPVEVLHYKMPVLGFRMDDFTYITDAKTISPSEIEKIKGTRYLVLNALQTQAHISHFTLEEAIAMAQVIGAEMTYFTHISHNMGLHAPMQNLLPSNIRFAYDSLTIEIS